MLVLGSLYVEEFTSPYPCINHLVCHLMTAQQVSVDGPHGRVPEAGKKQMVGSSEKFVSVNPISHRYHVTGLR